MENLTSSLAFSISHSFLSAFSLTLFFALSVSHAPCPIPSSAIPQMITLRLSTNWLTSQQPRLHSCSMAGATMGRSTGDMKTMQPSFDYPLKLTHTTFVYAYRCIMAMKCVPDLHPAMSNFLFFSTHLSTHLYTFKGVVRLFQFSNHFFSWFYSQLSQLEQFFFHWKVFIEYSRGEGEII